MPLVSSDIDGRLYAVVNVNTFDDEVELSRASTDFDSEAVSDRLDRRSRNWISAVTMTEDAG